MRILNQQQHEEYIKKLRDDGFPVLEEIYNMPTEETFKILEERLGPMPWNLIKIDPSHSLPLDLIK